MSKFNEDGVQTYAVDPNAIWSITCCKCRKRRYIVAATVEEYVDKAKKDGWVGKRIMNVICPECIADIEKDL